MGVGATVTAVAAAAQQDPGAAPWGIYFMFAVAGLMVGATVAAYQNDAKKLTVASALIAVVALAAALIMLIGGVR